MFYENDINSMASVYKTAIFIFIDNSQTIIYSNRCNTTYRISSALSK